MLVKKSRGEPLKTPLFLGHLPIFNGNTDVEGPQGMKLRSVIVK